MRRACIICGESSYRHYSKGVVECQVCGLVAAEHFPSDEELRRLYQKEYFFGKEYFDYKQDRQALEHNFRKRIKSLDRYLQPDASLVEVGCAYGYFLNLVKGKVGEHRGYDVSVEGITFGRNQLGLNVFDEDFLDAKIKPGSVDLVCMWDVIEHLAYPDLFLQKIAEILKPDGILAFTTGDISGIVPRIRQGNWRMIHPPTHLYYFSPQTARRLLQRFGFRVESIKHPGVYRNAGSVINQLRYNRLAKGESPKALDVAVKVANATGLVKINIPLNTFDIMEVVAVKL